MGPFLACGVPLVNFLPNRFPIDRSQQGRWSRVQPSKQQGIHTFALGLSLLDPTDQDPHVFADRAKPALGGLFRNNAFISSGIEMFMVAMKTTSSPRSWRSWQALTTPV